MARKKRRKAGTRKSHQITPGWVWMLMGLTVGLAVAAYVYISDLRAPARTMVLPSRNTNPPVSTTDETPKPGITFDFYDMLPNLDVEVYEDEQVPVRSAAPARVRTPGIYILQAGSFRHMEDANRRKAELALVGVHSEIKRGLANQLTVYRVYTDPMEDPAEVNRVSETLNNANIEILLKRVSD